MNEAMKQPTTPDSTTNPTQGPLCSSALFAIRRKKDGALLLVDKDGKETWQHITTWEENDLVLEPDQEIVSIANDKLTDHRRE